jgi:hypothetical protein
VPVRAAFAKRDLDHEGANAGAGVRGEVAAVAYQNKLYAIGARS